MSEENNTPKWYVVHTYSGYENKVKVNLEKRIEYMNMGDKIFRIEVPQKTVTQMKGGKKQEREEKIFPGYVLVEMIMTDEAWYIVRNTPGVTGFIGSSGGGAKPFPVNKRELDPILKSMGIQTTAVEVDFVEGDYVEVLAGPFASKSGKVESIDKEKETATVLVDFLGNLTPIDMELIQLKKIEE